MCIRWSIETTPPISFSIRPRLPTCAPKYLRASGYMEPFKLQKKYEDGWLDQIAAGKTYVTPTYEHDDYGYFLTSHVPIYDSHGAYSGFVGVDFDLAYYLAEEARFRKIEIGSLVAALMVALAIGFLVALYYGDLQRRMRQLYHGATHDDLTGLLNRRGAQDAVNKALARDIANYAMLLVDIDHLKMIVAMRGQSAADAVVVCTAEAIRQAVHEGDICARLGEGEFMVFFADCDIDCAKETAERILDRVRHKRCRSPELSPRCRSGSPHMERTPIFPGCTTRRTRHCTKRGLTARVALACLPLARLWRVGSTAAPPRAG